MLLSMISFNDVTDFKWTELTKLLPRRFSKQPFRMDVMYEIVNVRVTDTSRHHGFVIAT